MVKGQHYLIHSSQGQLKTNRIQYISNAVSVPSALYAENCRARVHVQLDDSVLPVPEGLIGTRELIDKIALQSPAKINGLLKNKDHGSSLACESAVLTEAGCFLFFLKHPAFTTPTAV